MASSKASAAGQLRACQVCAISKAKCTPRVDSADGRCERCSRLDKNCTPGQVVPRKPRRKRVNRTAQLEEKLENLVSLLASGHTSLGAGEVLQIPVQAPLSPQSIGHLEDIPAIAPQIDEELPQISDSAIVCPPTTSCAEQQLQIFRDNMTSCFPFVVISPSTTAEDLQTAKPFLYDSIMMVTSYSNVSQQSSLRFEVMRHLIDEVYFSNKKSLDILQALLVFIAWYHHHLWAAPQLANMVQLAAALVFDLGLHRTHHSFDGPEVYVDVTRSSNGKSKRSPRELEERRAFLGLFCLSRRISANIGRTEPLQNTSYVKECCVELEKQQEYPSDHYLVFQVKAEGIADASFRSFTNHDIDHCGRIGIETVFMLVNSSEKDLEKLRSTTATGIGFESLHQIHLSSISMHNTEICFRLGRRTEDLLAASDPLRLRLLMTCLQSTQLFFTHWLSLPSSLYHHLPINIFALLAHASIVMGMLNVYRYDGWDLCHVRKIAPFAETMDKIALKFEEASQEADDNGGGGCSAFWRTGLKMKRLRNWFDAKVTNQEDEMNESSGVPQQAVIGDFSADLDFGMMDDPIWQEIISWTAHNDLV